jgi:hypothetical protein
MNEDPTVMAAIQLSGRRGDFGPAALAAATALLAELNSDTDLAVLVERVVRNRAPRVVVPAAALRGWEERDPLGWAKVSAWLTANDVAVVRI